ncbi:MAG: extracellular solute-binding protein [Gammaproteobacteria bacterium]|nr:extracellular solute-binding protein [Gammaproteobacteria bacterium]
MRSCFLCNALLLALAVLAPPLQAAAPAHGIAMHGDLKYGPDFAHFEYANPDAPKGGDVKQAAIGTYDSFHPFVLKGMTPSGIGLLFETLMVGSDDEAFSQYGLIAESVEVPEDRSWAIFNLREEARFHDGTPITAKDVVFSLDALKKDGHPFYRSYYKNVDGGEALDTHRVRFTFSGGDNRELPLIVGQLPVLPAHYWSDRDFSKTTLEPPLGSGPYRIKDFEQGRSVTYERVPDYWGADLPVNRGQYNFDTLRYDYYRDTTVALQAFKAGAYDFRQENTAKDWATGYDFPAVRDGRVIKEEIPHQQPQGMQAYAFNTRRAMFADPRVRQALGYAFDFEWTNQNLFNGAYTRTRSYYSNSELASRGMPSPAELALLEPHRDQVPAEVFEGPYEPPRTDGSGRLRDNLRKAVGLLREAGWTVQDGRLTHTATGEPMAFEVLLVQPLFERVTLPFARNLKRLGIDARVRTVDATQYQNRLDHFDFDMVVASFRQSLSPGNEQRDFWGSEQADIPGSRNIIGIEDPVVDHLVDQIIAAPDRASLVARTRALDRVLLWSHYVIPHWHITHFRVAYWNKFARPAVSPKYDLGFNTWWIDPSTTPKTGAATD